MRCRIDILDNNCRGFREVDFVQHTSKLFSGFRERLGIPAPGEEAQTSTESEGDDR